MHIVLGEFWKREKGSGGCRLPVGSRVVGSFIMPCGGCFFCVKVYSSSELFPLLYLTICHHLQSSLKYYKSSSCFQDQLNALMPLSENGACPYCIDLHAIAHAIVWNYGVCPIMLYWLVCILLWWYRDKRICVKHFSSTTVAWGVCMMAQPDSTCLEVVCTHLLSLNAQVLLWLVLRHSAIDYRNCSQRQTMLCFFGIQTIDPCQQVLGVWWNFNLRWTHRSTDRWINKT